MDKKYVKIIWQVMEELNEAESPADALAPVMETMKNILKCSGGVVWLCDDTGDRIIAVAFSGCDDYTGISIGKDEGLVGKTIYEAQTQMVTGYAQNKVNLAGEDFTQEKVDTVMCVPVGTPGHTIGCMMLFKEEGLFDDSDKKICENVCAVIALDIEDKGFVLRPFEDRKPILSLRGVVKEFANGSEMLRVLKGIDLDVYEGELVVVLGESGCGKSTMLNIIGGMDKMTEGSLTVDGKDMSDPSENDLTEYRRKYIGFIFQAYNLMPNLSAIENVEFIAEITDTSIDPMEALRLVGLEAKANNFPSSLSGGQMQRVSIARAIVKNPRIILADEPTAALDYETSIKVLEVIEKVVKERKTTVIMVTHNPEIAKMANRVIRVKNGKISSIRINLSPMKAVSLEW